MFFNSAKITQYAIHHEYKIIFWSTSQLTPGLILTWCFLPSNGRALDTLLILPRCYTNAKLWITIVSSLTKFWQNTIHDGHEVSNWFVGRVSHWYCQETSSLFIICQYITILCWYRYVYGVLLLNSNSFFQFCQESFQRMLLKIELSRYWYMKWSIFFVTSAFTIGASFTIRI